MTINQSTLKFMPQV